MIGCCLGRKMQDNRFAVRVGQAGRLHDFGA